MKIQFGKYAGTEVNELPSGYIEQLLRHVPIKDKKLKECLERELKSRIYPNYGTFAEEYYEYMGDYPDEWLDPLND